MDLPVMKRRSARQLAGRKRSIYYESDSDDDSERFLRDSPSEPDNDAQLPSPSPPPPVAQRPRKKSKKSVKPVTRSKKTKTRPLGAILKKKTKVQPVEAALVSDGVRPAWEKLPVDLLRDIFIFASQSLHDETTGSANVTWLMKTARKTSPDFAVPALEAFYLAPAFHNTVHPHYLLELLQIPADQTYIKYKFKVKRLEIGVRHLAYQATNKPPFDLSALVRELPNLQQLEVVHPTDRPPYRPIHLSKWYYPADLFDALDETGVRLRTWRWSRDMLGQATPEEIYRHITETHQRRSFERLDRLVICGFDFGDSAEPVAASPEDDSEDSRTSTLASAICALPNLRDLTFSSCDLVVEDFLLRLPKSLERLELTNCLEITSDILQSFLATHGSQLRELVLNSNAALNLSFLTTLKGVCPKLEVLTMDTTYYSERTNYNDAYAFYDHLLTQREVPTWPSTLRHLEFSNLQKWGADAASTLFQSLLDAAEDLPDLRRLTIQAHIDIAWRDRADFRDNWVDKLRATFLHKTAPPTSYLCSLKRYREWKEEQPLPNRLLGAGDAADEESNARRLSHVRITPSKPGAVPLDTISDSETEQDSEPRRPVQPRRSTRVAETLSAASAAATPGSETTDGAGEDEEIPAAGTTVQGLCEVVDIRIDNQRPRETQYTEANFIDSEVSGDEDWHSGAELSDDGYAW